MVSKNSRGRPKKFQTKTEDQEEEEEQGNSSDDDGGGGEAAGYEKFRDERIKANLERMKNMGILDLSRDLNTRFKRSQPRIPKPSLPPSEPPRRSSRLKSVTAVSYSEKRHLFEKVSYSKKRSLSEKKEKVVKKVKIDIPEGSKPEVYTEEHEKLLGDSNQIWDLYVDGFDDEGQRIYDQFNGRCCHQCRQKILCHHTNCGKCKLLQGTLCGDCLYSRYGENVMEANANQEWSCPACRGICNCSRCRRINGWAPTGSIYKQVKRLGYKSVAHYLIKTRGPNGKLDEEEDEFCDEEDDEDAEGGSEMSNDGSGDDGEVEDEDEVNLQAA